MKIGIVTLFGDNYGNKLQNLAVQKLIESYGYEAETILVDVKQGIRPVKSRFIKKLAPAHIIKSIKTRFKNKYLYKNDRDGIIKSIYFYKKGDWRELVEKRKKSFSGFKEKYLKISKNKITLTSKSEKWLNEYDFFICGSDQIWNPTYKDVSSIYFLQFVDSGKRIALSPSIGLSKLPKHIKPLYKKWIEEIPYLSVREESGAKIIKDLTGRNAEVLADPTLCVAREEWELIEEKPKFDTDTPYVFAYFLGNEINSYRKYIENFANKKGYKVFNIFDLREPEYYSVNPAEFVYLIHHAEMVFTDSFHASVFSIIMKTPFIVFDRVEVGGKAMSSRIDTLLKTFSFENRKFSLCTENPDLMNFGESEKIISELKNKMDLFLKKAFTSEIKQENKSNCYVLERKEDCSGCTACVSVCPKNCITLNADLEGFSYPVIDSEECINCKLCKNICQDV